MKFFIERNLSSSTIDLPGHSRIKRTGENHEGKLEVHHKFETVLFEDKSRADKAASVRDIDTHGIFLNLKNTSGKRNKWNDRLQLHAYMYSLTNNSMQYNVILFSSMRY